MEAARKRPIVKLIDEDGNAFAIMARVLRAMKDAGYSETERKIYQKKSMSGDYDNLLRVTGEWVEIV